MAHDHISYVTDQGFQKANHMSFAHMMLFKVHHQYLPLEHLYKYGSCYFLKRQLYIYWCITLNPSFKSLYFSSLPGTVKPINPDLRLHPVWKPCVKHGYKEAMERPKDPLNKSLHIKMFSQQDAPPHTSLYFCGDRNLKAFTRSGMCQCKLFQWIILTGPQLALFMSTDEFLLKQNRLFHQVLKMKMWEVNKTSNCAALWLVRSNSKSFVPLEQQIYGLLLGSYGLKSCYSSPAIQLCLNH